ncbi:hypothetical protein [Spongiibacter marinus]|uniref:hypothetical protein n=1 Tax=Spongiibacter marinus TaxID=354246 RepID=UPI0035BE17CC
MDKDAFIVEVEKRLLIIFKSARDGYKPSPTDKNRLEGFMQAGVFLGVVENAEMSALMERTHFTVFGKSIAERKTERSMKWSDEAIDYSQFESPTYERKHT